MKGKYFLDVIDGVLYSTNNYEIYNLMYPPVETKHVPLSDPRCDGVEADKDAWQRGIKQEIQRYKDGYIYKSEFFKIKGKVAKKGRWVKDSVKAKEIFDKIKQKHLEGFF